MSRRAPPPRSEISAAYSSVQKATRVIVRERADADVVASTTCGMVVGFGGHAPREQCLVTAVRAPLYPKPQNKAHKIACPCFMHAFEAVASHLETVALQSELGLSLMASTHRRQYTNGFDLYQKCWICTRWRR